MPVKVTRLGVTESREHLQRAIKITTKMVSHTRFEAAFMGILMISIIITMLIVTVFYDTTRYMFLGWIVGAVTMLLLNGFISASKRFTLAKSVKEEAEAYYEGAMLDEDLPLRRIKKSSGSQASEGPTE